MAALCPSYRRRRKPSGKKRKKGQDKSVRKRLLLGEEAEESEEEEEERDMAKEPIDVEAIKTKNPVRASPLALPFCLLFRPSRAWACAL